MGMLDDEYTGNSSGFSDFGGGEGNRPAYTGTAGSSGGGGKKSQPTAPAVPSSGIEDMMAAYTQTMTETMSQMMAMTQAMAQQQPSVPELPSIYQAPEIDWTEERERLASRMKADTALDRARKTTRDSTVLTSPLLDDDEAATTKTLLTRA